MEQRYKIIDSRTRETLSDSMLAHSHTQAEAIARANFPNQHVVASLFREPLLPEKKKRTRKR